MTKVAGGRMRSDPGSSLNQARQQEQEYKQAYRHENPIVLQPGCGTDEHIGGIGGGRWRSRRLGFGGVGVAAPGSYSPFGFNG
jgi:hypothetical protein